MALGLNKVILIGNVGKDPEFRSTSDGRSLATFSFATTEAYKSKINGERKETTEWHRIVVFNEGLVDIIKQHVKKGSKLYLEGTIRSRKYVVPQQHGQQHGQERFITEIILQNNNTVLILLDNKTNTEERGSNTTHTDHTYNNPIRDLNDEIPF